MRIDCPRVLQGTQATLVEVLKFEAGEEPAEESKRLDIQEIINSDLLHGIQGEPILKSSVNSVPGKTG